MNDIKRAKWSVWTIMLLLFTYGGYSQQCNLNVTGGNSGEITEMFQLNAAQKATLETLSGDFELLRKDVEDQIQKLFEDHPQSTQEELTTLSAKYKMLQQKMVKASWEADKSFLQGLNPKQYQLYLDLCTEAILEPITVTPVIYTDSIPPKKE